MPSPVGLEPPAVADPPRAHDGAADAATRELTEAPAAPPGDPSPLPRLGSATRLAAVLTAVLTLTAVLAKAGGAPGATTLVEVGLVVAGGALAVAATLAAPTPRQAWGGVTLLLLAALATWTALSTIWSAAPDGSWREANLALAYLATFAGGLAIARLRPRSAGAVLAGVLGASTIVAAVALALKSFPVAFNSTEELARLRDPLDYWNALGLFAAFAVPACLWLGARREGPPALRALAWPLLGTSLLVVLLSYSRGVLVALAIGMAFWFAFVPLRLRGLLVGLAGAAAAAAVGAWAFAGDALSEDRAPLAQRVDAGEQLALVCLLMVAVLFAAGLVANRRLDRHPPSASARRRLGLGALGAGGLALVAATAALSLTGGGPGDRVERAWDNFFSTTSSGTTYGPERLKSVGTRRGTYWDDAREVWSAHKVTGAGAGAYAVVRKRYREDPVEVQHAHGYVPQTAADLGIVGLAVSLALLVAWIAAAARTLGAGRAPLRPRRLVEAARAPAPRRPVDGDRVALLTLTAVVVTFGAHSLIDWTWLVPGTAAVALACAGYLAGRGPAGVPGPARTRPFGNRLAGAALLAAAGLAAAWAIWQPLRAERASEAALAALESGRPQDALVQARAARERNPLALQPLFEISQIEDAAGRRDRAQRALERAVRLQPANPASWSQLASYQLNVLGQAPAAFQSARAALFLDPKSASAQSLFLDAYRRLPRRPIKPGAKRGRNPVVDAVSKLGRQR